MNINFELTKEKANALCKGLEALNEKYGTTIHDSKFIIDLYNEIYIAIEKAKNKG